MKKFAICGAIAAALLLSSCATSDVEETTPDVAQPETTTETTETTTPVVTNFEGAWVVEEFVKDDAIMTGATANIEISAPVDGIYKVFGNAGVNNMVMSDFVITENTIAPKDEAALATTMKAGLPEAMDYEAAFLEVMRGTNSIALDGEKLVISNDTAKITFTAGSPAAMPIEAEEDIPVIEE